MDIPVSQLNKRMASRLPNEFPLGLVFVVGRVESANGRNSRRQFHLVEGQHRIRCRLSERAARSAIFDEGDTIRAGGHLAFDALWADYYLLARDVEIVPEDRRTSSTLAAIIADMEQRSQAAGLVPAELPDWVKELAPPEVRGALSDVGPSLGLDAFALPENGAHRPGNPLAAPGLPPELLDYLSEAMDGDEEVELTPQLLSRFDPLPGELNLAAAESSERSAATRATAVGSASRLSTRLSGPHEAGPETSARPAARTSRGDTLIWYALGAAVVLLLVLMVAAFVLALARNLPG